MFNTKWMEQLGLEVPTTLEEFENVLRTMKAAGDLNGNGEDDEIILGGAELTVFYIALAHAFGIEYLENEYAMFAADENGQVYDQYTTENNKAMLTWLNQMYDEGILDSEITVNKGATMNEKVATDRVGVTFYYAEYVTTYGNLTSSGIAEPYSEQYTMGVPMGSQYNDYDPKIVKAIRYGGRFTGISTDCENPELAIRWLDTVYADPNVLNVRFYGKEGESYYFDESDNVVLIPPEDGSSWAIETYGGGQINLAHMRLRGQTADSRALLAPWWDEQYQVWRDGDWWIDPTVPKVAVKTDDEQMIYDLIYSEMNAGWKEYRDRFITGELDVEADWDDFVETMKGLNVDELREGCFQSIVDRTR